MTKNKDKEILSRPLKPNDWFMYQMFYIVAESRTLFEAERRTGFSFHYISKILDKLEDALGLKLLVQGNRRVELTAIGRKMYQRLEKQQDGFLDLRAFIEQASTGNADIPLRMAAPYSLAAALLTPFQEDINKSCPSLKAHLDIVRRQDLHEFYDYDCALFPGKPTLKNVCADYLYTSRPGIYASHDYLEENGIPESFDAMLDTGDIITAARERSLDKPAPEWGKPFENNYDNNCIIAQHIQFLIDDVAKGRGFGILFNDYTLAYPIKELVFDYGLPEGMPVHFIYPKEHKDYKSIQELRDFLLKLTEPLR